MSDRDAVVTREQKLHDWAERWAKPFEEAFAEEGEDLVAARPKTTTSYIDWVHLKLSEQEKEIERLRKPDPRVDQALKWSEDLLRAFEELHRLRRIVETARPALGGFEWLGNNLHNIKEDPEGFERLYRAALEDSAEFRAALKGEA